MATSTRTGRKVIIIVTCALCFAIVHKIGQPFIVPSFQTPNKVRSSKAASPQHASAHVCATAFGLLVALGAGPMPANANWGYVEKGADWGAEYSQCDGKSQAPIDIKDREVEEERAESVIKQLNYKTIDCELENLNGRTVQINGNFGSMKLPDGEYDGKAVVFHVPSEHVFEGKGSAAEMHIVHQKRGSSGTKDLAIIGMLFTMSDASDGPEGTFLKSIGFGKQFPGKGEKVEVKGMDLMSFDSQLGGGFYHYKGSLTTPPCTEEVHWYILKRAAPITRSMVDTFKTRFPANNRGIMPLNGRLLYASTVSLPDEF